MTLPPIGRSRLKAALAAHGAAPRKRHGQHFLLDECVLAAMVAAAGVGPGDRVLEVGPGPGLLTRHLLAAGAEVFAVEIDPLMAPVARELIEPELAGRLTWRQQDALAGSRRLGPAMEEGLSTCSSLVANLPYSISAPLIALIAAHARPPARQVVTVQREMAARLAAGPGEPDYGTLSVRMGLAARVRRLRRVPAGAFWPAPKVQSEVVEIVPRAGRLPPEALLVVERFVAAAFHNRRKTLVNSVAEATGVSPDRVLAALQIPEKRQKLRAEAMSALELADLARTWADSALGERHRP